MRLRLYTRGNVNNTYLQDYAIVIEVIDEKGFTSVYNDISREFKGVYHKVQLKLAA